MEDQNLTESFQGSKQPDGQIEPPIPLLRQVESILDWFGSRRDHFLIVLAVIYALGYLVWAINSWQNNLGLLPALDFQYFISGIIPLIIIIFGLLVWRWLSQFLFIEWPKLVGPNSIGYWRIIRRLLFFGMIGSFSIMMITFITSIYYILFTNIDNQNTTSRILIISMYSSIFFFIILPPMERKDDAAAARILGRSMAMYLIFLLVYFGILIFISRTYQVLPQEIGGVRPRCAYFDVSPAALSSQTRNALLPRVQASSTASVVRTLQLEVLYSNTSVLMVQPYSDEKASDRPIYEIKRDDINSIYWCDPSD